MSPMNESCHLWMSHDKYAWVISHMDESYHAWVSHVIYVMSPMNDSCHLGLIHVTYDWVMSHVSESCHIRVSHVAPVNESCILSVRIHMSRDSFTPYMTSFTCDRCNSVTTPYMTHSLYITEFTCRRCLYVKRFIHVWQMQHRVL